MFRFNDLVVLAEQRPPKPLPKSYRGNDGLFVARYLRRPRRNENELAWMKEIFGGLDAPDFEVLHGGIGFIVSFLDEIEMCTVEAE